MVANQVRPGGQEETLTQEDVSVFYRNANDAPTVNNLEDVWAMSWDRTHGRILTVDCRDPHTGIGEVWTFPAESVKADRSTRRRRTVHPEAR